MVKKKKTTKEDLEIRKKKLIDTIKRYMKKYSNTKILYNKWSVGLVESEKRLKERYKEHQAEDFPNIKADKRPKLKYLGSVSESSTWVLKEVEKYFTKHPDGKKQTQGSTGGVEKPIKIYLYKRS